jgi:hypothetical protein
MRLDDCVCFGNIRFSLTRMTTEQQSEAQSLINNKKSSNGHSTNGNTNGSPTKVQNLFEIKDTLDDTCVIIEDNDDSKSPTKATPADDSKSNKIYIDDTDQEESDESDYSDSENMALHLSASMNQTKNTTIPDTMASESMVDEPIETKENEVSETSQSVIPETQIITDKEQVSKETLILDALTNKNTQLNGNKKSDVSEEPKVVATLDITKEQVTKIVSPKTTPVKESPKPSPVKESPKTSPIKPKETKVEEIKATIEVVEEMKPPVSAPEPENKTKEQVKVQPPINTHQITNNHDESIIMSDDDEVDKKEMDKSNVIEVEPPKPKGRGRSKLNESAAKETATSASAADNKSEENGRPRRSTRAPPAPTPVVAKVEPKVKGRRTKTTTLDDSKVEEEPKKEEISKEKEVKEGKIKLFFIQIHNFQNKIDFFLINS